MTTIVAINLNPFFIINYIDDIQHNITIQTLQFRANELIVKVSKLVSYDSVRRSRCGKSNL